MMMHNPPHPGEVLVELYLKPLELSIKEAADGLGVSRRTIYELINGHRAISVEMAERLALAFGGEADTWLRQQIMYDLWQQKNKKKKLVVHKFWKKAS